MKKVGRFISITALALLFIFAQPVNASAAEIKVWTARAKATVLAAIGPEFERMTGHKLNVTSDLPSAFARRAQAGEQFDILISGSSAEVQSHVMFTAGVSAYSKEPEASRQLISFLTGSTAIPVVKKQGMEPAR